MLNPKSIQIIEFENKKYKIKQMDNYQEIISRLKFLCKLNKGEKVNTKYMFVQPEGFFTSFSRTFWFQDNRSNVIKFIQETISRAFELLYNYDRTSKKTEQQLASHLFNDLKRVSRGLEHLKVTYLTDTKFCCDIDTIIENIMARLITYNQKYGNDMEEIILEESDN